MAIKSKKKIYLEYRYYNDEAWRKYDETQVHAWADSSFRQMIKEFPGAQYRRRVSK